MKKISLLLLALSLNLSAASSLNSSRSNIALDQENFHCPNENKLEAIKDNCLRSSARASHIVKSKSNITNNRAGFRCPDMDVLTLIKKNCLSQSKARNLNLSKSNMAKVKSSKSNTSE